MHHRGLGMRTLGRLAMAAALIVPVGAVTATSAGAASTNPNQATCSGTGGAINSQTVNNGVGDHGGLLLARKGAQKFQLKSTVGTNTNPSTNCSGGVVNGGNIVATFTTATAVNCQTAPGVSMGGVGTITWTSPAGMGKTSANVQFTWRTNTSLHYSGSVTANNSTTNVFKGDHVSGNVFTQQSLAATASGGNCSATIPLTHFDITSIVLRITSA